MKTKRDKILHRYGVGVLLRHVQAVRQEIEGTRLAQDIEYVHRMRVASRRLRTAFDLFPMCLPAGKRRGWLRQVRKITRALGAARDADVQIELLNKFITGLPAPVYATGIRRLLLRLRQQRQAGQIKIIAALDSLEKSKLLDQMESTLTQRTRQTVEAAGEAMPGFTETVSPPTYSAALYRLAYQSIHDHLEDFLSFQEYINKPEEVEQLHAMRIAAKHLRYTLEAFAPLYPDELKSFLSVMRKTQEALGDIHDSDVWAQFLPQFLADERQRALEYTGSARPISRIAPGIHYFEQDRRERREKLYTEFTLDWAKWNEEGVWDKLAQVIQSPLEIAIAEPAGSITEDSQTKPD